MAMPVARGLFRRVITHERPADHRQPRRAPPPGTPSSCSTALGAAARARRRAADAADGAPDRGEPGPGLHGPGHRRPGAAARSVRPRRAAALGRHPDDPRQHAGETRTLIGRGNPALFDLTWATLLPTLAGELAVHGHSRSRRRHREVPRLVSASTRRPTSSLRPRRPRGRGAARSSRPTGGPCSRWPRRTRGCSSSTGARRWTAAAGAPTTASTCRSVFDNAAIVPETVGTGADAVELARRDERRAGWPSRAPAARMRRRSPPGPIYDLDTRATMVFDRDGSRGRRSARPRAAAVRAGALCPARHVTLASSSRR